MLMAAIAFNLKKLMKFLSKKQNAKMNYAFEFRKNYVMNKNGYAINIYSHVHHCEFLHRPIIFTKIPTPIANYKMVKHFTEF